MRKVGRPKSDVRRNHVLSVRMNDDEWEILKNCADLNQSTMTDVARKAVLDKCLELKERNA